MSADPTADAASLLFWGDLAENAKTEAARQRAMRMVDLFADRLAQNWARRRQSACLAATGDLP